MAHVIRKFIFISLPHIYFHGWTIKMQTSTKKYEQIKFLSQFHKIKPERHQNKKVFKVFILFFSAHHNKHFHCLSDLFLCIFLAELFKEWLRLIIHFVWLDGKTNWWINKRCGWNFCVFLKNHGFKQYSVSLNDAVN